MFYYPVILLVLASTVRSSVVINVFEDGEIHSLRGGCNLHACEQLCRRLGFPGGACVGDKCKCDNFTPLKEVIVNSGYAKYDSCNYQACDQLCRRLGFPGGACVGDKCKCDNFAPLAENKAEHSARSGCDHQACDQKCRSNGFIDGACGGNGDECKCKDFEPIKVNGKALEYFLSSGVRKAAHSFENCNAQACDQLCRNLGFPGGACVGDKCDCDNFKEENEIKNGVVEDDIEDGDGNKENSRVRKPKDEPEPTTLPEVCVDVSCDDACRRLNFHGGMCRNGDCYCY